MRLRGIALILLVASLGLSAAACGGDDEGNGEAAEPGTTAAQTDETGETEEGETEDDGGGEGTTLELAADPDGGIAFDQDELSAAAGPITISFTNAAAIPHNVSVEGQTSETIQGGATTELDLDLEAGEYDFICAVPGHAAQGMTGTLTVE